MNRFINIKGFTINTNEISSIKEFSSYSECHKYGYTYFNSGIHITMKNGSIFKICVETNDDKKAEIEIDNWIDSLLGNNDRKIERIRKKTELNNLLTEIECEKRCNYCEEYGYYKHYEYKCKDCVKH